MRVSKKWMVLVLALILSMAMTVAASAADYTVKAGSSVKVSMSESGNGGIDGSVKVSGGATATYSSSEAGGITSGGTFYLYNGGTKTVTVTVTAPKDANIGDLYTVEFSYNSYDAEGNDSGLRTVKKTVEVGEKNSQDAGTVTGGVNTEALKKKIDEAGALDPADYTEDSWNALQDALTKAEDAAKNGKNQADVDVALEALNSAMTGLVKIDYSKLLSAIESAGQLGQDNESNSLWVALIHALQEGNTRLSSRNQAAVDTAADEINNLLAQIQQGSGDEPYCNVPVHKVWPVLFFISLAANVVLVIVIVMYVKRKKKNLTDNTPLVDYDITDDE